MPRHQTKKNPNELEGCHVIISPPAGTISFSGGHKSSSVDRSDKTKYCQMTGRILSFLLLLLLLLASCSALSIDPRPDNHSPQAAPPLQEQRLGSPLKGASSCTGSYTLGSLRDVDVCTHELKHGQTLIWNGTRWTNKLLPRGVRGAGYLASQSPVTTTCRRGQILLCHVTPSGSAIELCVAPSSVDTHLTHPHDKLGPCSGHSDGTERLNSHCPSQCDQSCPLACDDRCSTRCDEMCPSACDDVCPSACSATIGQRGLRGLNGPQGGPGLACWDLNEDGVCNLPQEDANGDGVCSILDCRGTHGPPCWDLNGDGECTLDPANPQRSEDKNGDLLCTVLDCQGFEGPEGHNGPPGSPGPPGLHGTHCWDSNSNGICDVMTEDINGDGVCTASDCLAMPTTESETFPGPPPGVPMMVSGTVSCASGTTVMGGGCRPSYHGNDMATAFLIESAASGNDWKCSYAEISESPRNRLLSFVVEAHCV